MSKPVAQLIALLACAGLAFASGYLTGKRGRIAPSPPTENGADPFNPSTENQFETAPGPPRSEQIPARQEEAIGNAQGDPREDGFQAAQKNVAEALQFARTLEGREQAFFVAGVFKSVASQSTARNAIALANDQQASWRGIALQSLVTTWTGPNRNGDRNGNQRQSRGNGGNAYGMAANLTAQLAQSDVALDTLLAWQDAFAQGPARSEIAARLATALSEVDPSLAWEQTANWTDWERERFADRFLQTWSESDPQAAWNWQLENPDILSETTPRDMVERWAKRDTDGLIQQLDAFEDPSARQMAIEAIAAKLAGEGTAQALDWVDSLPSQSERDSGMQAVYEATPKGIGALLKTENGFPKIQEIVPGGALEGTGARAGDLIVQSRELGGEANDLHGAPLHQTVGRLRGQPGSAVELRLLRENPRNGQLEEHSITVERDLLILDPNRSGHGNEVDSP